MTRAEVLSQYAVKDGTIVSPGKFEGEPLYAPYYYEMACDGWSDPIEYADGGIIDTFRVEPRDVAQFPELRGVEWIAIEESENGFMHTVECTAADIAEMEATAAAEWLGEEA